MKENRQKDSKAAQKLAEKATEQTDEDSITT